MDRKNSGGEKAPWGWLEASLYKLFNVLFNFAPEMLILAVSLHQGSVCLGLFLAVNRQQSQ